jgi:putative redox protein
MALIAATVVKSKGGYAQEIEAGGHRLTADEPASNGGTNTGPSPYALLLSALGACTSITLRMYADRKGWALGEIHVALRHEKTADGADRIAREIRFAAPLTDEQRARLAEIAEKTPVTKTVKAGAPIETRLV